MFFSLILENAGGDKIDMTATANQNTNRNAIVPLTYNQKYYGVSLLFVYAYCDPHTGLLFRSALRRAAEIYRKDRDNQRHNEENNCEPLGPLLQDRFLRIALVLAVCGIIAAARDRRGHVLILLLILHQAE